MNVNQRGNTNNTSNTRTKSTNQNSTQYRDVGFEPSADGSFELDEDSEHSFELRDCKSAQSKKE